MASSSSTLGVSPNHGEDGALLRKAYKKIDDLKEDIRRLSLELERKELQLSGFSTKLPRLSSFFLSRAEQSSKPSADSDTVVWDPAAARPPCSTPNREAPWSEVVVRGHGRCVALSPPSITTSNRFDILSTVEFPVLKATASVLSNPPRRDPALAAAAARALPVSGDPAPTGTSAAPPPVAGGEYMAVHPRVKPPSSTLSSSAHRRLLKEAVRRNSGSFPHRDSVKTPQGKVPPAPLGSSPSPRPLFPPTTAIIGDSIIRHVRFFNAVTRCFPGSTAPTLLQKLPELLDSLPSTVNKLIIHLGFNDSSLRQSEVMKEHFNELFKFLAGCGKSVFISGPLPSFARGSQRFSRLLSLSTWLKSACMRSGFNFIDNFNLFWNHSLFYRADGIHPSKLGSRALTDNICHAVHTATHTPD